MTESKKKFLIDSIIFHSSHGLGSKYPDHESMPHIAFCGRSNAGKSSLINAVVGKKDLVKVSSTPGKTRTLNFFLLNQKFFLVDLPGFGYSKASYDIRETMIELVNHYLNDCKNIKILFILCDSSRDLPEDEVEMIRVCYNRNIIPILVRTKFDKLNTKERDNLKKNMKLLKESFSTLQIIYSSVKNKSGIGEIQKEISKL